MRHDVYVLYGTISCAERYLILCVDRKCKTDVSAREHLFFCLKIKFVLIWSAECRQVLTYGRKKGEHVWQQLRSDISIKGLNKRE